LSKGAYVVVEDPGTLTKFIKICISKGYLRKFNLQSVSNWICSTTYPVRVPIKLEFIFQLGDNAIVKHLFGNLIEKMLTKWLKEAMGITDE